MTTSKHYDGYRSFAYLQAGVDYEEYPLARRRSLSDGDASPELSEEEKTRIRRIFAKNVTISMREHGFVLPERSEDIIPYCSSGHTAFDYEGIATSGLVAFFDNFMDGVMTITSRSGLKWNDVIENLGMRYCDIAHQETVFLAQTIDDIKRAKKTGKVAVIPCLEAATAIENELDRVDLLYGFGIRCMGITYNETNTLGSGLSESRDGGLTQFGHRVVRRMNRLGMAIDISHCGDATGLDVIEASEKPVLITHAGARALWNTPRMVPDEVLLACRDKGGVIGILAAPNTTLVKGRPKHDLDAIMAHFEYIANLVGIDHVGFGPDTMYGDHVALQNAVDSRLSIGKSHSGEAFDESPFVEGIENPSEAMPNIVSWLVRHGYRDRDIAKVTGGNVLRALEEIWVK